MLLRTFKSRINYTFGSISGCVRCIFLKIHALHFQPMRHKQYKFSFRFLWPCIVSKVWRETKDQQDATIRCLLSTSVSTCIGHHYAHLQENKDRVTAYGVLLWFCSMWLVAVVGRCVIGCEHCVLVSYNAAPHNRYQPHPAEPAHQGTLL